MKLFSPSYARISNTPRWLPIPPLITPLVLPFQVRPSKMAARVEGREAVFFLCRPLSPLQPSVPLGAMHHPESAAPERMDLSHFGRFQNRFRNSFIFSDFPRLPALIPSLSECCAAPATNGTWWVHAWTEESGLGPRVGCQQMDLEITV